MNDLKPVQEGDVCVSYRQILVYDESVDLPGCLWTDEHGYDAYRTDRRFGPIEKASWEETIKELPDMRANGPARSVQPISDVSTRNLRRLSRLGACALRCRPLHLVPCTGLYMT